MKPRNFPARKLARQIAADLRSRSNGPARSTTARELYRDDVDRGGAMTAARQRRSKKPAAV